MALDKVLEFTCPTKIIHGVGTASKAGVEAKRLGATKALLVTDRGVDKAGVTKSTEESLKAAGIPVVKFAEVEEDPRKATVAKGTELLKKEGCDCVVIVGGGSPLCAGKGIALLATNGGSIADYNGVEKYKKPPLPVIGIPTTAGSGSEVSRAFVLSDEDTGYVLEILGFDLFPRVAILDPLLLATLPKGPMIAAGIDALSHAVESIWTNLSNPLTDAIAFEAIRMIFESLPAAAYTDDLGAKSNMLYASAMANIACGNAKLGLAHALANTLHGKMPHGVACGVLMLPVLEFNYPLIENKLACIAGMLGEDGGSTSELAEAFVDRLEVLYADLEFPTNFDSKLVPQEQLPELVKKAIGHPQVKANIRKSSESDLLAILKMAFDVA